MGDAPRITDAASSTSDAAPRRFRRFAIEVVAGAHAGTRWAEPGERCTIGSHPSNDLVIADPTVSRFHCEVTASGGRFRVRDLGSRNGTRAGDIGITDGEVGPNTVLVLGDSRVRIAIDDRDAEVPATRTGAFGTLVGSSAVMREVFSRLERAAGADATVLIEGETGTGKEGAAAGIHAASGRARGPFVAVDCGAVPPTLFEAELFGTERGAFTGAERHTGAFEAASGGTLFLDEIGELALEAQAKLLRAIETRTIRRLGSRSEIECDVRIVAATNRDLRERVNSSAFRADLYYRLAVLRVALPPLRDRTGDLPELVAHFATELGASAQVRAQWLAEPFIAALAAQSWPGNIRELRNHLEQVLVFGDAGTSTVARTASSAKPDARVLSYDAARKLALASFERDYVDELMRRCNDNVAEAAALAGVNRAYLYRLLKRHRG